LDINLIIVGIILSAITIILIFGIADIAFTVAAGLVLLMVLGIIDVQEGLEGFSNQGMLTIALMYIIANAVKSTGVLDRYSRRLMGEFKGNYPRSIARITIPVAGISAFMNNTPVVAILIPIVKTWCRNNAIPASKFLIPISYATIVGGACTLIGTSTTLIIHGMLLDMGDPGFTFFEPMKVGIGIVIICILYLVFIGYKLLPSHKDNVIEIDERTREFIVTLKVTSEFPNLNQPLASSGLLKQPGIFLFQIHRGDDNITEISPKEIVKLGDHLFFTGVPSTVFEIQKTKGLELIDEEKYSINKDGFQCFEAVVSNGSPLLGKTVRTSNFRDMYDAVILAIHRHGHRLDKKISDVSLIEGDTLLILAKSNFGHKFYHSKDFLLVSEAEEFNQKSRNERWIIFSVLASTIILAVAGILPLFLSAAISVGILFMTKVVNLLEAVKSMNWKVLIVIASSLGISKAVSNVGIPDFIGATIVNSVGQYGFLAIIVALVAGSMLLSEFINNAAAAAVLFPIAAYLAQSTGFPIHAFALALLFGATSSFSTPIGYQTNMMVQGPGNYEVKDFLKIGLPLNILSVLVSSAMIYFWFN
jgi:di/tricarboxylate transporter